MFRLNEVQSAPLTFGFFYKLVKRVDRYRLRSQVLQLILVFNVFR